MIEQRNGAALSLPLCERRQPGTSINVISSTLSTPASRKPVTCKISGIDIHKKELAVVVADIAFKERLGSAGARVSQHLYLSM